MKTTSLALLAALFAVSTAPAFAASTTPYATSNIIVADEDSGSGASQDQNSSTDQPAGTSQDSGDSDSK